MVLRRKLLGATVLGVALSGGSCGDPSSPTVAPEIVSARMWYDDDSVFAQARATHPKGNPELSVSGDVVGSGTGTLRVSVPRALQLDSRTYSATVTAVFEGQRVSRDLSALVPGVPLYLVLRRTPTDSVVGFLLQA